MYWNIHHQFVAKQRRTYSPSSVACLGGRRHSDHGLSVSQHPLSAACPSETRCTEWPGAKWRSWTASGGRRGSVGELLSVVRQTRRSACACAYVREQSPRSGQFRAPSDRQTFSLTQMTVIGNQTHIVYHETLSDLSRYLQRTRHIARDTMFGFQGNNHSQRRCLLSYCIRSRWRTRVSHCSPRCNTGLEHPPPPRRQGHQARGAVQRSDNSRRHHVDNNLSCVEYPES